MLARLPKAVPPFKSGVRSVHRGKGGSAIPPLPVFSLVPPVAEDSSWILAVLGRQQGPTSAEDVCILQLDDPEEFEEADVRAWYYRLFEEHGPWVFVPDGVGTPTTIDTPFPRPNFEGMPLYYRFLKSPRTTVGREWRLVSPDGARHGVFVVRRLARLTGQEVNALDRLLHGAPEVPVAVVEVGKAADSWHFGGTRLRC